jgi:hypothetical protein
MKNSIFSLSKTALLVIGVCGLFAACDNDDDVTKQPLVIPTTYDGATFDANTTTQKAVTAQLKAITDEAKKGRVNGTSVSKSTLDNLFTTGTPSLKSVSTTYYAGKLEGETGWLAELAKASGGTYTPGVPTGEGGTFGGYLFDENGLEMEQLIEKGQFGAVLYKHATELLSGTITPATVDQVMAILGTNPTFPSSNDATKHAKPDAFMAVYAARRDKNDGNGFYSQLKNNFIKLQAATKAGADYKQEQDEAIAAIKLTWEKVNAATVINYCHAVTTTMSKTSPTDAEKAAALHAYGECVGFIHGWRTIAQDQKKITDAQIDEILTLLNASATGTPTSYKFITDPVNELAKLTQVIDKLKTIYGFTTAEIEDFRKNWVTEQAR